MFILRTFKKPMCEGIPCLAAHNRCLKDMILLNGLNCSYLMFCELLWLKKVQTQMNAEMFARKLQC